MATSVAEVNGANGGKKTVSKKVVVRSDGVKLKGDKGVKTVNKGTVLEYLGNTEDRKNFRVRYNGEIYTVSPADINFQRPETKPAKEEKTPKPAPQEKKQAGEEVTERPVEQTKVPETPRDLEGFLQTDEGKLFDTRFRSLFDTWRLTDKEIAVLNDCIKAVERKIFENGEKLTFKVIDDMSIITRKGFLSSTAIHCLKAEYRNRGGELLDLAKIELKDDEVPLERKLAESFLGLFVTNVEAAELEKATSDNVIDREEAKKYGISDQLFDIIDRRMDTKGVADGKITKDDIERFKQVIKAYADRVCDGNEKIAIERYKSARGFEMMDMETVDKTAAKIEKDWNVTDETKFADLKAKLAPGLQEAVKIRIALLNNKKPEDVNDDTKLGKDNAKKICLFIASLPLRAQLEEKHQKELMGVKEKIREFKDEVTEENILNYVKAGLKNSNTSQQPAQAQEAEKTEETQKETKQPEAPKVKVEDVTAKLKLVDGKYSYKETSKETSYEISVKSLGASGCSVLVKVGERKVPLLTIDKNGQCAIATESADLTGLARALKNTYEGKNNP